MSGCLAPSRCKRCVIAAGRCCVESNRGDGFGKRPVRACVLRTARRLLRGACCKFAELWEGGEVSMQRETSTSRLWKNPVETISYPRAVCHSNHGQFVTMDHGHFVTQAYRVKSYSLPIAGRARLWKAKSASKQDAGPDDGLPSSYFQTQKQRQPQNQNLPMKANRKGKTR